MSFSLMSAAGGGGWNFRTGSIRVSVPWNALLGIAVIAILWFPVFAGSFGPIAQAAIAIVFGLLLMGSVLLHEFAHAWVARIFGYRVSGITLWAMGGVTSYQTNEKHGPGREAAIAASGPICTLAIAAASWVAASAIPELTIFGALLWALAWANLLVGVFNLVPGLPLDGGSVVKAIVWAISGSALTGTLVAAWCGRVFAVLLAISPFALAIIQGSQVSIAYIVIALMLAFLLWMGATSSLRSARAGEELRNISAYPLGRQIQPVAADATVEQVLPILSDTTATVAVSATGQIVGVVSQEAAQAVPVEKRTELPVAGVSTTVTDLPQLNEQATAWQVVQTCQDRQARFILVQGLAGPRLIDADEVFTVEGP